MSALVFKNPPDLCLTLTETSTEYEPLQITVQIPRNIGSFCRPHQ